MPSDARFKIKNGAVKSIGTMEGDILINGAKSSYFIADSVYYVNTSLALQVVGTQGGSGKSRVIAVDLEPKTDSGAYKFGDDEIIRLSYYPPREEPLWTVIDGGINITFVDDGKRAYGTIQIVAKRQTQTLEAFVSFDVRN